MWATGMKRALWIVTGLLCGSVFLNLVQFVDHLDTGLRADSQRPHAMLNNEIMHQTCIPAEAYEDAAVGLGFATRRVRALNPGDMHSDWKIGDAQDGISYGRTDLDFYLEIETAPDAPAKHSHFHYGFRAGCRASILP